jgi:hypothetical protein
MKQRKAIKLEQLWKLNDSKQNISHQVYANILGIMIGETTSFAAVYYNFKGDLLLN